MATVRQPATRGLRLGSIAGSPVILTGGSAVLAVVLYALFLPTFRGIVGDGPILYAVTAVLPVALLASILLHEVAHGLTARAFGIPVTEYVLTIWGGHTSLGPHLDRPGRSALVAMAGPGANAVIAVAAWLTVSAVPDRTASAVLLAIVYVNALLAIFNVLPGLPMDGGRLLESAVWAATGDRSTGTLAAGRVGQVLAAAVAGWGVWAVAAQGDSFRLIWSVLIAGVLWTGARDSVQRAKAQRAARGVDLLPLVTPALVLPDTDTIERWAGAGGPRRPTVLVRGDGFPSALVQPEAAGRVPAHALGSTSLRAVSVPVEDRSILAQTAGAPALAQVARAAQAGIRTMVVVQQGPPHRVIGVLGVDQVISQLR